MEELQSALPIIVLVLMAATATVLISGIFMMAKGGEANQKYGNKMMSLRVTLQALTLIAFAALVLTR